jgi:tetratricopeptide (TPR) repeat protein
VWLPVIGTAGILVGVAMALWLDHGIVGALSGYLNALRSGQASDLRDLPASSGWGELSSLGEEAQEFLTRAQQTGRAFEELERLQKQLEDAHTALSRWLQEERWEPLPAATGPFGVVARMLNDGLGRHEEVREQNREAARQIRQDLDRSLGDARQSAEQTERGFVEATSLLTTVRELQRLSADLGRPDEPEVQTAPEAASPHDALRAAAAGAVGELVQASTESIQHLSSGLLRVREVAEQVQVLGNVLLSFNVAPPGRPGQESAEVAATLRSLGYVSGSAPERKVFTEADDLKNLVVLDRDLHTASELYQSGKVQEAMTLLDSVIHRRPDTADAYISLAHAYWESGSLPVAIATLERALTNGAPDRDVRIRLGIYLAESQTDPGRAIKLLEGLPVSDVEALNGLGVAYGGAGRYPEAIQAFKKVLALDPTNGLAYQNLASMVLRQALAAKNASDRQSRLQEAERYARQALDTDPSLPKAYTTLGVVLAESGRKSEAIDSWKRAVALDGREFDALYNLTVLLLEAQRLDGARAYARQFVATAPPALYGPAIEQMRKFLGG